MQGAAVAAAGFGGVCDIAGNACTVQCDHTEYFVEYLSCIMYVRGVPDPDERRGDVPLWMFT